MRQFPMDPKDLADFDGDSAPALQSIVCKHGFPIEREFQEMPAPVFCLLAAAGNRP
jgi:hypothetical protein